MTFGVDGIHELPVGAMDSMDFILTAGIDTSVCHLFSIGWEMGLGIL